MFNVKTDHKSPRRWLITLRSVPFPPASFCPSFPSFLPSRPTPDTHHLPPANAKSALLWCCWDYEMFYMWNRTHSMKNSLSALKKNKKNPTGNLRQFHPFNSWTCVPKKLSRLLLHQLMFKKKKKKKRRRANHDGLPLTRKQMDSI